MIRPILACKNPYKTAEQFRSIGWNIDFTQPAESGDPLVGISLYDNQVLLGITEGYVDFANLQYRGCGIVVYLSVPFASIHEIYKKHLPFVISPLSKQTWGDFAFEIEIDGFRFMIASSEKQI